MILQMKWTCYDQVLGKQKILDPLSNSLTILVVRPLALLTLAGFVLDISVSWSFPGRQRLACVDLLFTDSSLSSAC